MARPVIALLTDFGLRDHYVAAMKGVALGICPDATFIDISHDIPPQDILAGALELEAVAGYLPASTVVVGVVDPGVGSRRRGVAVEAGGVRFVGPDNGLFTLALKTLGAGRAVSLSDRRFALANVSRTFEGRDRFAPAAAWLAAGKSLGELGPAIDDLVRLDAPDAQITAGGIDGIVLRVDHFGNLVTNIRAQAVAALRAPLTVSVGEMRIEGISATYADASAGAACALIGSTERLEVAVNGGHAARALSVGRGAVVLVRARAGA